MVCSSAARGRTGRQPSEILDRRGNRGSRTPVSALLLALLCALLLGLAPPRAALATESTCDSPAPPAHSLIVVQVPATSAPGPTAPPATAGVPKWPGDGARIVLLRPDEPPLILTRSFASACDPDVSFDGTHFVCAGKRAADDAWNVYEMTVDGQDVRQITSDLGDCRSPGYQSSHYQISIDETWRQLTFVRTDPACLSDDGSGPATALYSCKLDGTLARRLTYNLSSDFDPTITWDGRLLYSSWQRRTLEHGESGRVILLDMNTDGTDYAPFVVGTGRRIKHMACSTPSGLAVFVETDEASRDGAGTLASVSLTRPLGTYRQITTPADGLFHSPSPLPDGSLLVSRRSADGSSSYAVCRLDPSSKQTSVLFDDPRYHDLQAKSVAVRAEPDGRSSSVIDTDPKARLYCLNVYSSDLKNPQWMPPGTARRLRVVEGVPRTAGGNTTATHPGLPQLATRRLLGEVPIARDGSFNVEVPANTPLELQLLDESGLALRSCGWIWSRNHFSQGCIGCHEDCELTPENVLVDALNQPSVSLAPPVEERTSVNFRRDILPIVTAKCLGCHDRSGSFPLLAEDAADVDPAQVYAALVSGGSGPASGSVFGRYIHAGRARTSPLVWHIMGRNTARPWDGEVAQQAAKPIPPDSPAALVPAEREALIRWIDLGAPFHGSDTGRASQPGVPGAERREP